MKLNSPRLILIPLDTPDLRWFHQLNTLPSVRQFLWDDEVISQTLAQGILQEVSTLFQSKHWGLWKMVLPATQESIGYVGLWDFFEEPQPQLVYALHPDHTGKGYATEASQVVITYAFEELGFTYLLAATDSPHHDSQAVCKRLGMALHEEKVIDGKPTRFFRIAKGLT